MLVFEHVNLILLMGQETPSALLLQLLYLDPIFLGLKRHAKHSVGEANVVIYLWVSFDKAASKTLLKGSNSTAQVSLVNPELSSLLFLLSKTSTLVQYI